MSRQKRTGTKPELALRRALHRRGLRFRVSYPVPGRPRWSMDLAFTRVKVAVFVDGCFWHACPDHATWPRENATWWRTKLSTNVARDRDTDEALIEDGWDVIRIWEHADPCSSADVVAAAVARRRAVGGMSVAETTIRG